MFRTTATRPEARCRTPRLTEAEQHPGERAMTAAADDKQVSIVRRLDQGRHRMSDHEDALD
jgi:hypothetical protein